MTPSRSQPSEIEMHRMAHQVCRSAGWESPEEVVAAYKTLEAEHNALLERYAALEHELRALQGAGNPVN